jgi:hypothetical protein
MSEKEFSELVESLVDFCNGLESLVVNARREIKELIKTEANRQISEDSFSILSWQDEKGSRLGCYQVAYKNMNLPEKWLHCFNILKANSSLISNPFTEQGYVHRYWIYPDKYSDRIFRKKISENEVES